MFGKFIGIVLAVLVSVSNAVAVGSVGGGDVRWRDDITVKYGEYQDLDNIIIERSITIDNTGIISGTIHVCDGCRVYVRNHSGAKFLSDIVLGDGATLTQLVSTADDMTKLNFRGVPYDVVVSGPQVLSMVDVMDVAADATRIIFDNSRLYLNGTRIPRDNIDIVVRGQLDIYVSNVHSLPSGPLLTGISGDGTVLVHTDNLDPMYIFQGYIKDNSLYTRLIRFTTYRFIFDDARGKFLDELRQINPGDGLLRALDAAWTRAELESIMARSVRINPINMMRPVGLAQNFQIMAANMDRGPSHMIAEPMFIVADDFDLYGFRAGVHARIGRNFTMDLTGYAATGEYKDDINNYSTEMYGANIAAEYDMDILFLRGIFGMTYAMFDVGPVFDGIGMTFDPDGKSFYGAMDVGHAFRFLDGDAYVSPFVGLQRQQNRLLNTSERDGAAHVGMDAGYKIDIDGIKYDYGVRVTYDDADRIGAMARISVWSHMDAAGGDVMFGITDDDIVGRAYRVSFGARFQF